MRRVVEGWMSWRPQPPHGRHQSGGIRRRGKAKCSEYCLRVLRAWACCHWRWMKRRDLQGSLPPPHPHGKGRRWWDLRTCQRGSQGLEGGRRTGCGPGSDRLGSRYLRWRGLVLLIGQTTDWLVVSCHDCPGRRVVVVDSPWGWASTRTPAPFTHDRLVAGAPVPRRTVQSSEPEAT